MYKDFSPSGEYAKFKEANGEDTFLKMNLLYAAFLLDGLYRQENSDEFDDLCEDVLELSLAEEFDRFSMEDVAEAVEYIIRDSNYTIQEYHKAYKRDGERVTEELIALLDSGKLNED